MILRPFEECHQKILDSLISFFASTHCLRSQCTSRHSNRFCWLPHTFVQILPPRSMNFILEEEMTPAPVRIFRRHLAVIAGARSESVIGSSTGKPIRQLVVGTEENAASKMSRGQPAFCASAMDLTEMIAARSMYKPARTMGPSLLLLVRVISHTTTML